MRVDDESIPVYGTPDGLPVGGGSPVYGTREPTPSADVPDRPPVIRRRSIPTRLTGAVRWFVRAFLDRTGGDELDWSDYPGIHAGDDRSVLDGLRLDDVLDRNDRVLARVRRALEAEFRVHWWANVDTESLEVQDNAWGGASMLQTAHSATWRTTSGLTSVEDRDMAARIVGVALTHEGFEDQSLQRLDDEWVLSARHADLPESVLTLRLGYSEFELTLQSSGVLPAELETEFRDRAERFSRRDG